MAGGDEALFARLRPVLEVMGRPTLVGPVGTGELAKLVNQLIVAGTIAIVAEGVLLAERGRRRPGQGARGDCWAASPPRPFSTSTGRG